MIDGAATRISWKCPVDQGRTRAAQPHNQRLSLSHMRDRGLAREGAALGRCCPFSSPLSNWPPCLFLFCFPPFSSSLHLPPLLYSSILFFIFAVPLHDLQPPHRTTTLLMATSDVSTLPRRAAVLSAPCSLQGSQRKGHAHNQSWILS